MKEIHQKTPLRTLDNSDDPIPEHLVIGVFGKPGTGKTNLMVTAPGPIGIIPLEGKTMPTVKAANRIHQRQIVVPDPEDLLLRVKNPMMMAQLDKYCVKAGKEDTIIIKAGVAPACCLKHYNTWHINRVKDTIYTMVEDPDVRTICIDSGSKLKNDLLLKHYMRTDKIMPVDRVPYNNDWKEIIDSCSKKHLIITHHTKEIWRNNKPSGKFEPDGHKLLGHFCNILLEATYDKNEGRWGLECVQCQSRPELIGKAIPDPDLFSDPPENDELTFQNICISMYPETIDEPERWE